MDHYRLGGVEPSLEEVLGEPIVHLLMERDSVHREELLRLILRARRHVLEASRENRHGGRLQA